MKKYEGLHLKHAIIACFRCNYLLLLHPLLIHLRKECRMCVKTYRFYPFCNVSHFPERYTGLNTRTCRIGLNTRTCRIGLNTRTCRIPKQNYLKYIQYQSNRPFLGLPQALCDGSCHSGPCLSLSRSDSGQ